MPLMQSIGRSSGYPRSCKTATNSSTTSNVCLASSRDGQITNPKGPSPGIIGISTSSCKATKIRGRTKTRVRIALGTARGLEYPHEASTPRVLHRDLSSNILLDSKWRAKVADFGTAKTITSVDRNGQPSSPAKLLGTFGYFAPEYAMMGRASLKYDVSALE